MKKAHSELCLSGKIRRHNNPDAPTFSSILDAKTLVTDDSPRTFRRPSIRGSAGQLRGRKLLRILAATIAILLALQLSSALLTSLSLLGPNSADLSDLMELIGNGVPASAAHYSSEAGDVPKLIPRIIHQTYRTRQLPDVVKQYMNTWRDMNPGWEIRFYDDQVCTWCG